MDLQNKKLKYKDALIPIGLFLLYFILLSAFRKNEIFVDEIDNFMGGISVAAGRDVYSGFLSQHMPLMYYIAAIFKLLGASSILQLRISFYVLLSLIWMLIYLRYSRRFGKTVIAVYPIGYILAMRANQSFLSSSIVSEQLQAQGIVILLIEFLLFCETKEIKLPNMIMISFAIFISFGTAFVAIFPIAAVAVGVLFIEIKFCITNKISAIKIIVNLSRKYWKLVAIVTLPFIVLFVWYWVTDNLHNAYKGMVAINTEIYPKYNGGLGSSVLGALFSTIDQYFSNIATSLSNLVSDPLISLTSLLLVGVNIMFLVRLGKKDWMAALFVAFLCLSCGTRGFGGFHALPYWGVSIFMGSMLLVDYIEKLRAGELKKTLGKSIFVGLAIMILALPYMVRFSMIKPSRSDFVTVNEEGTYPYYIDKITGEDDMIQLFTLDTYIYIQSDRLAATSEIAGGACPWMYEAFKDQILNGLKENKPKVVVFNEEGDVWGYFYKDFAPEVVAFVKENYTQLAESGLPMLYVRNDYYDTALQLLE
jgi:hypothetical protein